MGVNIVLVNIAWSRPYVDAVTLEHVAVSDDYPLLSNPSTVALRSKQLSQRVTSIHAEGMKAIGLFGIPAMVSCQIEMLTASMRQMPLLNDYMFYTYDQHAWLCSEFGSCPKCAGVPLATRLSEFINTIKAAMAEVNPQATFWWQPWELSLGQILDVLDRIDSNNFGLMLNTSGIESYFNNLDNAR